MRVQLDTNLTPTDGAASISVAGSAAPGNRDKTISGRDDVSVSVLTTTLNRLGSDHATRLQQIASSVASGSYKVPASVIAGAIVGYSVASK